MSRPRFLTYGVFTEDFSQLWRDFEFYSEDISDLCAIAALYPRETKIILSTWEIRDGCVIIVDELHVGFE